MAKQNNDDLGARKARAEAIRQARDEHNTTITPPDDATGGEPPDEGKTPKPNYVDFIDRKMRERDRG